MNPSYEARMLRVLTYIHDNPDGDLSLDALADVAAMSRFHWHRVFHAMTGETCADAVRRIRLNRAACWLVQTDWPIAEIAERCGYGTVPAFSRAFRVAHGQPPGLFRQQGQVTLPAIQLRKGQSDMFVVKIETRPNLRLAGLDHIGPYLEIGSKFEQVATIAASRNLWPQVRGMAGIYMDDPAAVPEQELRSFAGLVLADGAPLPDGLTEQVTQGGDTAVLTFKGPYSGLKAGYDYLYSTWITTSEREMADAPCYEVYLNSPADTAPEELLTEICVPLK